MPNIIDADQEIISLKPVIKWAGGKSWFLKNLQSFVPKTYRNYHEPFLGGASVFLSINPGNQCFLSDANEELINFYTVLKDNCTKLIEEISTYENNKDFYYLLRDREDICNLRKAARFYFLNQTCFNGLYRVNKEGKFNVPYGKIERPIVPNLDLFNNVRNRLQSAIINCYDFEKALDYIGVGDFIFLDPPYTVAHNFNGFIEYNKKLFNWEDQERLATFINKISQRKAYFVLTNAYHVSTIKLYSTLGKMFEVERISTVGGQAKTRKLITELVITNCV